MINLMKRRDARSLDHGTLEELRRLSVRRVLAGERIKDVAASIEQHPNTVSKWMAIVRESGEEGLASTKAPGAAPKLKVAQMKRLARLVIGKNPKQLNFGPALWTLPLVGRLITQLFDVVLHETTVSRMLHKLGITPQKPMRRAFQRDEDAVRHWVTTEFPAIVRASKRRQSTLLFSDETGVQEDNSLATTWGLRGKTPVVAVKGSRRRINVISAISVRGRLWFRCYKGTLTSARFIEFLRDLLHDTSKPIDLVIDRHPAHTAAATMRFINKHRARLRVHWLPGYAPNLNPSEHVWSLLKGFFRRNPLDAREDLAQAVEDELASVRADHDRVRAFFGHPEVSYIHEALGW
jgi:transposase